MKNRINFTPRRWLLAVALFLCVTPSFGQRLIVRAPANVNLGERFYISFDIDEEANGFMAPSFKGLSVLSGPNKSNSRNISWVNGNYTNVSSTSFSYILCINEEGKYTVESASCVVNGKRIYSSPFTIIAKKGSPNRNSANQNNSTSRQQANAANSSNSSNASAIDGSSLFARATVSNAHPYMGEQVILSYKIYTQVSLQQYQIDKLPGNKGFWSEDLSGNQAPKQYEETINGKRYMVAEIRRGAIFAQDKGKLRIEPLSLDVLAMVPVQRRRTGTIWDLFDDPFFNQARAVQKSLKTNVLNINVKPLPAGPDNFSGAVGSISVKSAIDHDHVKANEAITYRLTVSGRGNLSLLEAPEITFPKVFEVYDPKITDHIVRNDNGISGTRTFEWVLIPQAQGDYEIPALEYVYFNPKTGKYVTLNADGFKVKVDKGNPNDKNVTTGQQDVKMLNNDINHIHLHSEHLRPIDSDVSLWQWILLLLPVPVAVVMIVAGRKRQALEADESSMKLRRATKLARKRLRVAERYLNEGNDERFYEEIYKAVWGCLSDKYGIKLSQLSRDTVNNCLQEKNIAAEVQALIMRNLEDVDEARFAPGDSSAKKKAIYDETLQTIASL